MSIDPKFVELTADVLEIFSLIVIIVAHERIVLVDTPAAAVTLWSSR